MDLLWISEREVAETVTLSDAIDVLREWLLDEDAGGAESIPKALGTFEPRSSLHALGALSTARGRGCFKTWVNTPKGRASLLTLFDTECGRALAVIESGTLGLLRTAAISGVATDHLAPAAASTMGIIGSGHLALRQVEAVHAVRPLSTVIVHSPTPDHRRAFATQIADELGIAAQAVDTVIGAVDGQPIVTLISRAREPFLSAAALLRGAHVNAVGAILPANAEMAGDVAARSSLTVVDSVENARRGSRELIEFDRWEKIAPLHRVVAGAVPRPSEPELTIFKGMGMGLSDLAVASLVFERALERDLGRAIPMAAGPA